MMGTAFRVWCSSFLLILILSTKVTSYEKTLRKIVRNQSKMVQKPFSEGGEPSSWKKSLFHLSEANPFNDVSQIKAFYHNQQGPKISSLTGRSTSTFSKMKIMKHDKRNERLTRNSLSETSATTSSPKKEFLISNIHKNTSSNYMTIKNFYQIPVQTKFFPPIDELEGSYEQQHSEENTIATSDNQETPRDNATLLVTRIPTPEHVKDQKAVTSNNVIDIESNNDKPDFYIDGLPIDRDKFTYNLTVDPLICQVIKEIKTDIDAQNLFAQFNIEPLWVTKKHFWNEIFENRYETLMRNPKWPPLKVILVPRVKIDTIWKTTFEHYHKESVSKILSNIVKKLHFYDRLTFSWNEVSHLSYWWKNISHKTRSVFRKLIRAGRLEIATGGWVEPDEATTHLFGLIHQLIEGHQWLKLHLNYTPKVAWLTNSVAHSPTMAYLLAAFNINKIVFTNLHYSWQQYLAEYQYTDFIWLQNWDQDKLCLSKLNEDLFRIGKNRYPKHAVLAHFLQYNSAGFGACGPKHELCFDYNFANASRNLDINSFNIKEKSEKLLEQYSKTGTLSLHNTVIAPLGESYSYKLQSEFDYQFNNYLKIADFVNFNKDLYKATMEFGTTEDYFMSITGKNKHYPTVKGDFLNFADIFSGQPAYWAGFYTSRPFTKILLRRLEATLRSTEILFAFAASFKVFRGYNLTSIFEMLLRVRENVARLLDRNVSSGTVTVNTLKYVHNQILKTAKDCWFIQEISASFLALKPEINTPYLQKYVYRDGEFISVFRTISPGDYFYIFNSLSHERTEIIDVLTKFPNIRIIDHNKKDASIQINPIWKYNSDNLIKLSRKFFKVSFAVTVPPMTLVLYKIKDTYDASHNAATIYCLACIVNEAGNDDTTFPFNIHPIQSGDIQLESYKYRLIFDELTGFLKTITEKETNNEKTIFIDYGAFKDSNFNSGMFVFNTNSSKPLYDILMNYRTGKKSKVIFIVSGQVSTELITIYGRLLQHTTKIFNLLKSPLSNAIYIESKIDFEASPKNRELEMFLSIQTDIANGNPPQLFTDNNGFQYTSRILNISRRIESNLFPITSMAYIQDKRSRLTLITDHAQGITALQEGQLVVMLDRRVLYDDGRGSNEGLADSSVTSHRHYILLENLINSAPDFNKFSMKSDIPLPSFDALHLANTINYFTDVFVIEKNYTDLCYYMVLPLTQTTLPCDVAILNYRIHLTKVNLQNFSPSSALMIMHRQSFSCQIDNSLNLNCLHDSAFSLNKILGNMKAIFKSNLPGTCDGETTFYFDLNNFPPMELMSIRIDF